MTRNFVFKIIVSRKLVLTPRIKTLILIPGQTKLLGQMDSATLQRLLETMRDTGTPSSYNDIPLATLPDCNLILGLLADLKPLGLCSEM